MEPSFFPTRESLERAKVLHGNALVFDAHADTLSEMLDRGYDLASAPDDVHLSWDRIAAGGLQAQVFACFVDPALPTHEYAARVERLIDRFQAECARFPARLASCRSAADIDRALAGGRFAGILSIEGGHAIGASLDLLRRFHARGVRAMTLTWNNRNQWADGCGPDASGLPPHGGLTPFGREVIAAMEDLGMAVDLSHAAPATWRDAMETASRSPFASHSACAAVLPHRRNLTDDQMRELADRGGVMGLALVSGFLVDEEGTWERVRPASAPARPWATPGAADPGLLDLYDRLVPRATLVDAANHLEHALRVMGTDHVALGCDFDGARRFPAGIDHVGDLPLLTATLLDRGWKEHELEGFLGRNLLEYLRRVIG